MNKLININCNPKFFIAIGSDQWGGIGYTIDFSHEVKELLEWLKTHKESVEKEEALRKSNPALANQWDQYQTMLRIVMDDV